MNTIHLIAQDPFSCIYTSPDQIKLFKAYKKKNRFTKVSCDASGGVAHRLRKIDEKQFICWNCFTKYFLHLLERPGDEKSGQIFFYTMVISDGFQVPIYSMLSESNDANWLTYWMSAWVSRTADVPNQFTSDMSMALLNAAVRSFTSSESVADYIDLMFDLIGGNTANRKIPQCFVRIDIAHFMKNVTTCEALRNQPKKVRDFFIRCMAMLMIIDDFDEARDHILSVVIVTTSKTEGKHIKYDE